MLQRLVNNFFGKHTITEIDPSVYPNLLGDQTIYIYRHIGKVVAFDNADSYQKLTNQFFLFFALKIWAIKY